MSSSPANVCCLGPDVWEQQWRINTLVHLGQAGRQQEAGDRKQETAREDGFSTTMGMAGGGKAVLVAFRNSKGGENSSKAFSGEGLSLIRRNLTVSWQRGEPVNILRELNLKFHTQ